MGWRRLLAALTLGLLVGLAGGAQPASAVDDYLEGSDPQPQQELQEAPGWVTLAFGSKANAKLAKILVFDADGKNVATGPLIVEGTNVTTQLLFDLPKGTYTVMYRTSGADGRVRGGSFQFAYGKGKWTPVEKETWIGEAEEPPILEDPDPSQTPTATQTPTVEPSVSPPASPTGAATGPATTAPTTGPVAPSPDAGSALWLIGGGVLLLAVAGIGGWQWWQHRRGDGRPGSPQ